MIKADLGMAEKAAREKNASAGLGPIYSRTVPPLSSYPCHNQQTDNQREEAGRIACEGKQVEISQQMKTEIYLSKTFQRLSYGAKQMTR